MIIMLTPKASDDNRVLNDQMKAVIKQLPLILLVNLPLVAVLSWLYWSWVNQVAIIFWAVSMLAVMILRFISLVFMGPGLVRRLSEDHQQWILVGNSAISGILWAWAGALFFVEGKLDYQLIILMVLIVKGTGSVSAIINSLPAFYAYFPLSMTPITILFLLQQDMTSILLGVICIFFILIMLWFARNLNRTLLESIHMRYENRLLLEETEARKQEAEKANLTKTQFLAAASHDLRQPIHAMSLLLNVMEERHATDASVDILNNMRGTVDSLQSLLNALLDMSRLDAGAVKVNKQVINLSQIFISLKNEFQVLAQQKGLSLNCSAVNFSINTDPILLEQILRNLITNAIRYTEKGNISIEARLHDHDTNKVVVAVRDTGIGITPEQQADIFEEFYQVGNQQRDRDHGLGLGLAIVQRMIKLLGSRIELESSLGQGSSFHFELDCAPHFLNSASPSMQQQVEQTSKINKYIVIIEDDLQVSEAMQALLKSWGAHPIVGVNADSVMKKLIQEERLPDIIISDFQLADNRNGIDESKRIAEEFNCDIPTLIVTGNIEAEQLDQVKQAGFPILYKPVAPARLRAFLRSASSRET